MGIFSKKSDSILGLDISSTAIKVVELEKSGNNFRLLHYSIESLPQNAVTENTIADVGQVSSSISRAVKRSGARSRNVATAIPGSHVISKRIFMPHGLREDELENQISLEADHYIPYPLDEVNMDFEVLGAAADNPSEDEILLAACRKEIVDDYVAVLEDAGLTPVILDVEYYSVENAYEQIVQDLPGGGMEKLTAVWTLVLLLCMLTLFKIIAPSIPEITVLAATSSPKKFSGAMACLLKKLCRRRKLVAYRTIINQKYYDPSWMLCARRRCEVCSFFILQPSTTKSTVSCLLVVVHRSRGLMSYWPVKQVCLWILLIHFQACPYHPS